MIVLLLPLTIVTLNNRFITRFPFSLTPCNAPGAESSNVINNAGIPPFFPFDFLLFFGMLFSSCRGGCISGGSIRAAKSLMSDRGDQSTVSQPLGQKPQSGRPDEFPDLRTHRYPATGVRPKFSITFSCRFRLARLHY